VRYIENLTKLPDIPEVKLLLFTNRKKTHGLSMVKQNKSVTLNDLDGLYFALSQNRQLWASYVKVVEVIDPSCLRQRI